MSKVKVEMQQPRVATPYCTIAICTFGRPTLALSTLRQLLNQNPAPFQIIIIDQMPEANKEQKELEDFIAQIPVVLYRRTNYRNLPRARNFALSLCLSDLIIYIDDDVILSDNFIASHIEALRSHQVVAGRIIRYQHPERGERLPQCSVTMLPLRYDHNFDAIIPAIVLSVPGCNMSFSVDLLRNLGGFDERFAGNGWCEDLDMGMRIKNRHIPIYFDPHACLTHLKYPRGGCRTLSSGQWLMSWFANNALFYLKHGGPVLFPLFSVTQWMQVRKWTVGNSLVNILCAGILGQIYGIALYLNILHTR